MPSITTSVPAHRGIRKRSRPATRGLSVYARTIPSSSDTTNVQRVHLNDLMLTPGPLGPGRDLERHLLVLVQALVAVALDRREVREHVLAAVVRGDESEALAVVEPLDDTCSHVCHSNGLRAPGTCPDAGTSRERDDDLRTAANGNNGTGNFT